jgi:hypothetical protein
LSDLIPRLRQIEAPRRIPAIAKLRFLSLAFQKKRNALLTQLTTMNFTAPKWLLRLEGLAVLAAASIDYGRQGHSWGKFVLLFLAPDLLMVGYLFGTKVGAAVYNSGHTYAAPLALWLVALFGHLPFLFPLALIWAAHIGFDRLLGYGLKYGTGFKDTHLERV